MKKKMASKDFTMNDLPQNRKQVFFDVVKVRFLVLFRCGLTMFAFMLPLLVCLVWKNIYLGNAHVLYENGEMTSEDLSFTVMIASLLFDLGIIVTSFIASLGIAGASRVIRQLSWEEPTFFHRDFIDGIMKNYKQVCAIILILAVIYAVSDIAFMSKIQSELLKMLPSIIMFCIFVPIALYNLAQVNVYNIKVGKATINSILLFTRSAPVALLFVLVLFLTTFVSYIPTIAPIIIYVLLIINGLPMYYLAWFLYASFQFDIHINKKNFPELVGRGTHKKEDLEKPNND